MKQFSVYVAVGFINTGVGYAVIFLCMYGFDWNVYLSNVFGYTIGLLVSYLLNRVFTFKSNRAKGPELIAFTGVFCLAYLANLGALKLLIVLGVHPAVSQVLAGVLYVAISYIANKYLVFKQNGTIELN